MERARLETARAAVLTSPDLLERILALLPTPLLWLGSKNGTGHHRDQGRLKHTRLTAGDRWAAGQVDRAFRRAALSLPWEAYLEPYSSRPNISAKTLALVCGPRNVTAIRVGLLPRAKASCAALLCCASNVQVLKVSFDKEANLIGWLQHTQAAGPSEGMSVLASLSSLSGLTSLGVARNNGKSWSGASWVTALSRLRSLRLNSYAGPPVGFLPCLQSFEMGLGWSSPTQQVAEHALEDWAQPRLTALTLTGYCVRLTSAANNSTEPGCAAWLSQLQRLSLSGCVLRGHNVGLQALLPRLTYLDLHLGWKDASNHNFRAVVSRGLPLSLKELVISSSSSSVEALRSAVSALSNLVSLKLKQWDEGAEVGDDEVAAALESLTALPHLNEAFWFVSRNGGWVKLSWDRASGALHKVSKYF